MKKALIINIIIVIILTSCSAIKELISFSRCEFRIKNIDRIRLAGVNIEGKSSINDFKITDLAMFTQHTLRGTLPLDMVLNIEARNPNQQSAAINRVEWIAYIDDQEMMTGYVDERIVIPAKNGTGIIPLQIRFDMTKILKSSTGNAIANLALNLMNTGERESQFSVKIKPTILVGSFEFEYPGYFTISKEFRSGD
jgi:LEA14-like dessication related protein